MPAIDKLWVNNKTMRGRHAFGALAYSSMRETVYFIYKALQYWQGRYPTLSVCVTLMNRATVERLLKKADIGDLKSCARSFINIVLPTPSMYLLYNFHLWECTERRHQPVEVAISLWSRSITAKWGRHYLPTLPMSDGESGLAWLQFLRWPCGLALAIRQWQSETIFGAQLKKWQVYKLYF